MKLAGSSKGMLSRWIAGIAFWTSISRRWQVASVLTAVIMALPVMTVFAYLLTPDIGVWQHLVNTVLKDYVVNSLWLLLGVSFGTLSMGVITAWLTSICEFPGRRVLLWMLLLPMSMPAYIIAYTYTGMLDFAGPVQNGLRVFFHWGASDYWFPDVRSLAGAMSMLSLVLYPYVYLLARAAFLEQSVSILDASRTLGYSPWQSFLKISLPIARPAIVAGLALALMETLADYGTVQYFGIATFTTGIFRTWFGLGKPAAAAQLSALLMTAVMLLIVLESWSRRKARYHHAEGLSRPLPRYALSGWVKWLALLACMSPVVFGFLLPAVQLAVWAGDVAGEGLDPTLLRLLWHSMTLAATTSVLVLLLALLLAYARRLVPTRLVRTAVRTAGLGYAIPGTVIAVGVSLPLAAFDNALDGWLRSYFGVSSGLLLSGTLFALLFAMTVRFLAVALQAVEAGLATIRPNMDDSARSLGYRPIEVLRKIHIPILRTSLLTAGLLVFVDVLKELPATLVLRPFNFNTLAVRAYEMASDERLPDAALPALAIMLAGLIPVILLSRSIASNRAG